VDIHGFDTAAADFWGLRLNLGQVEVVLVHGSQNFSKLTFRVVNLDEEASAVLSLPKFKGILSCRSTEATAHTPYWGLNDT